MSENDLVDSIRQQVDRLVNHVGELRLRYADAEEEFREGNLDAQALKELNLAIHALETDTAAFEKILEA